MFTYRMGYFSRCRSSWRAAPGQEDARAGRFPAVHSQAVSPGGDRMSRYSARVAARPARAPGVLEVPAVTAP